AQYLIGRVYREQMKYQLSTDALVEVRKKYDSYLDWVYEAYLLIAENYISMQNFTQARATLTSIVQYSHIDKYKNIAKKRLQELEKAAALSSEEENEEEEE
ncbi:MAG: hypothetical protein NZ521_09035, partial [Flammeovirgaceae bacterium]|nr:hypothetical protein [Flammeovirgaceae bacterium]MDW8288354.1 hypothetical protein [Flammeovirgaceae bacterium]